LKRNVRDALRANHRFSSLSSYSQNTIYAADGNTYFAYPGPNLVGGTAILARCAYQDQPTVLKAIDKLASSSVSIFDSCSGWHRVDFGAIDDIDDVEDLVKHDFSSLHDKACAADDLTYTDPETGYSVMTEVAHKKRGTCCGSGCRHCPFKHENVKDKSNRIQQPAFMYEGESEIFSVTKHKTIKVLFFSGGKDSFLALRAQVREYKERPFGLVLLTTFDAQTRVIAHQNVHIDEVLRQSRHLDISLVGIPMHRESREPYVNRISRGLEVIQSKYGSKVSALIFGDLHLAHIKSWRDKELGALGFELEYPLWQIPYPVLLNDLEKSRVTFKVSATTKNGLSVGTSYTRQVHDEIQNDLTSSRDGFGENGEFHTIAQIWLVERDIVLGL
jgi:ATP-binding cassette subfamily B (MDR/TAP) protein 1